MYQLKLLDKLGRYLRSKKWTISSKHAFESFSFHVLIRETIARLRCWFAFQAVRLCPKCTMVYPKKGVVNDNQLESIGIIDQSWDLAHFPSDNLQNDEKTSDQLELGMMHGIHPMPLARTWRDQRRVWNRTGFSNSAPAWHVARRTLPGCQAEVVRADEGNHQFFGGFRKWKMDD